MKKGGSSFDWIRRAVPLSFGCNIILVYYFLIADADDVGFYLSS